MSADDMIYIQQNKKGRWVAQYWFASNDGKPNPEVIPYSGTYPSLQMATEMNHDRARETEYGFHIDETAYESLREERTVNENFQQELAVLLNKYSKENASGTPDILLAEYLTQQLLLWNNSIVARAVWRNEPVPGVSNAIKRD